MIFALSPLTNFMPVARLGPEPAEHAMAWVSVPELEVTRSVQRYEPLGKQRVRFRGLDDGFFTAELSPDEHGFVERYPAWLERVEAGRWQRRSRASLRLAVKTYHLTTFGCQMNEHDSERMKGMLESLDTERSAPREDAELILFNTCSIREKADNRLVGHLGEAKRLKGEHPERVIGIGGCRSQSVKERRDVPLRRRGVRAGPGAQARRVPHERQPHCSGLLRVRGLHRPPADEARARLPGLGADLGGLQLRARTASFPPPVGARCRGPRWRSWRRSSGWPTRALKEVTLLGQNVCSYGRDLPRGAKTTFAELLAMVDAGNEGIERIRIHESAIRRTSART